jgi:hypothetical protein
MAVAGMQSSREISGLRAWERRRSGVTYRLCDQFRPRTPGCDARKSNAGVIGGHGFETCDISGPPGSVNLIKPFGQFLYHGARCVVMCNALVDLRWAVG